MTDAIKTVSNRMEESWFCISGTLSMLPTTLQHSGAEWFCYWIFWPKDWRPRPSPSQSLLHSFLLPSLFIPYFIGPHDWPTKKGFCSLVFIYGQECTRMNDTLKRKQHWGRSVATYCSVVVPVGPVNRHTVSHISLYSNVSYILQSEHPATKELALTQMKSQQQQGYVMQRVHAINETISDTRESERAQILQLKRLEEIQSAAAEQISHVKAEQQQLENKLNKLSSETKMCIGQLNDTLRGIVEDVAHVASLEPKMSAPALPPESDSDAGPTPSDQTIVLPRVETGETQSNSINSHVHSHGPSHVPSHVPSHAPSQVSQVPSHVPQVTSVTSGIHDPKRCQPKDAVPNFTHSTRQSSPAPLRPLQNLSFNYKSEKPPIISANVFPRNDLGTERAGDVPQMVSPRMPVSQPVNWTMSTPRLTQTTSPMVSPRFVPSPQRSPRVAQNAQSGPQLTQLSIQPQILKAWQMRPLQRADVSNLPNLSNLKPGGQTGQTGQTYQAVTSPREALQDSSNSKLMTPRLEKSLPATERSRRVTSPTRNDAAGRCG